MIECIMVAGIAMWNIETTGNVTIHGDSILLLPIVNTVVELNYEEEDTVLFFYFSNVRDKVTVKDEQLDMDSILRKCTRI